MANHDTADMSNHQETSNTLHNRRSPTRPTPNLKRSNAFIHRGKDDDDGEQRQGKPEFPAGPLRVDRDEIYMLPGKLVSYAKAGMSAARIGQLLHRAVYDNDAPLGHLVTSLVDEGTPYAEIALTVFRYLDLRDDAGERLFAGLCLGDTELRPVSGPYVHGDI